MNLLTLLDMARSADADRPAIGRRAEALTFGDLLGVALDAARDIRRVGAGCLVFVGVNGPAWPVCLFAAAAAGIPVVPLNYRLADDQLRTLIARVDTPYVVADERYLPALAGVDALELVETSQWLADRTVADHDEDVVASASARFDDPAVLLFTSGTTSEPKCVVLRHSNLSSYVIQTVEFAAAEPGDTALVSVPPYHVAGVGTVLTNCYAGRRLVYLPDFTPRVWLDLVRAEGVTQVMLVPTMLARILDELGDRPADLPVLRSIAYGGAPMPRSVLTRALRAFPDVDFVNSYGLTETSSTIAILGPDDHRTALASTDPAVSARLASVGRLVPGMEAEVRDEEDRPLPTGQTGEVWVRGAQVAAEYVGQSRSVDDDGWFRTRDRGYLDQDGYLFLLGRVDDTIIRGGENIAPAEIETVLRTHPAVGDVAVVGAPDEEWGQRIVAAIVAKPGQVIDAAEVRAWTRARLRGSRTPDDVVEMSGLPYNPMGKLLRREVQELLATETARSAS